jgi:hypothetical protein
MGMLNITTGDLVLILRDHNTKDSLSLMGGASRNGSEYLLKKQKKGMAIILAYSV